MRSSMYVVTGVSALLALSIACGRQSAAPLSPSSSTAISSDEAAGPDGATLKVSKPNLVSPINDVQVDSTRVTLTCSTVTSPVAVPLAYDFEMYDASNVKVRTEIVNGTTWVVQGLEFEKRYTWRVRANASYTAADGKVVQTYGPWSSVGSFLTPQNRGYIRGNELYDPLFNGETIGQIIGPAHFIPGVGISLDSLESFVAYQLQAPLTAGEFSILATNVRTRHEGDKTKIMAMAEGYDDITTNNRRMTFEKRSDGVIAWRVITHDDQIDTLGAERQFVQFNLTDTFFFQLSWRNNRFDALIKQGGATGRVIYNFGKNFKGTPYDPNPHVVYIGGPGGRAGAASGSVPNIVIRQVWVSPNPRPELP
jgi:hypothetical protein